MDNVYSVIVPLIHTLLLFLLHVWDYCPSLVSLYLHVRNHVWCKSTCPISHSSFPLYVVSSSQKLLSRTFPVTCSVKCLFGLQLPVEILLEWAKLSGAWGRKPLGESLPPWISREHCSEGHEFESWWNNAFWRTWQFRHFHTGQKCSWCFAVRKVFLWLDFSPSFYIKLVENFAT